MERLIRICFVLLAVGGGTLTLPAAEKNPTWDRLSRTFERLERSTEAHPETMRVLFYGQSIVQQGWGPRFVVPALQKRYPSVKFVVENRAIGGYESPSLIKTAEADLYPFYPDLLFFHVYGPTDKYAKIVQNVRERTTADIVLWTSHLTDREGETTEKIAALLARPDARSVAIRATAEKFGCMFIDLRSKWCRMLQRKNVNAKAMLRDNIHMLPEALPVYAEMISEDLLAGGALKPNPNVGTVERKEAALKFEFTGNRVVALASGEKGAAYDVLLDGRSVLVYPEMWTMTRTSKFPDTRAWTPLIDRVDIGPGAPQAETWTLTFLKGGDATGKDIPFTLAGSETGADGEGNSSRVFISNSGRVVIKPDGWCSPFWWRYFKTRPSEGTKVTWRSEPLVVTPYAPGAKGERITLVQNCSNAKHTLELKPREKGPLGIAAFEVHTPMAPRANGN